MKLKGHSPVDLIINNRKLIEKIYIVLVIFSLICVPMVGINYDLTKYLPDSSPSAQALDIMEDEFTYPGMGRVMLEDVTLYEAKNIKDRIADVDGVDMVMWCDMATNIYGSSEFINYDNIDDYYKDNTAYMDVIFTDKDSSNQTHKAVHEIENIVGDKGLVAGSAVSDTNLGPTINKEVARVMALAVVIIYIILTITTTSWFEPVLFLSVLGIAILINMGTNIIFGEISFLSNAVGAVLQLACSMDYSIFLLHAFTQERATGAEPEQAMANAWRTAFSSIGASGMTTIVGFAAMALMNFGIGPDMGFVLAKGIALSLLTVLLLMPALILRSQNIIAKTQHRPFIPKQGRGIGEFAYKIRRIVFLVVLIIIIPCYIAQGMANFSYGNEAVANSPGTPVYEAEQQMNAKFGKSNMMIALVPPDSNITEKKMTEEIDDLSYVKYALSLSSVLPEGIPEDFLPENITSLMHSKNWARVIINVRSAGESDDASAESVMTSGLIVMTVAYGLYFMTSVEAISGLGQLIGRGALISVILVLFFLPMCLMLFDRWIVKSDYAEKKHAKMNKIRATKIKLPILSELHQQRVNLQNQIRENRKARNKELRLKLKNLMNGDGFKLPQNYTPPTQKPSKQQQTEESAHKRMIGKKLRMRIHNRIEMRKEQLEQLAQRLGSDKNKPNDSQNDNQNDNTEENDHENR